MMTRGPTDWTLAACSGKDPAEWDNETEYAYHHCQTCPLIARCRQQALLPESEGGSWNPGMLGGWTLDQRRFFKRFGRQPTPIVWEKPRKPREKVIGRPLSPADNARRMDLYELGWSDGEMAAEIGITEAAIESWRRYRKLPINNMRRGPLTAEDERNRMQAWELGLKDTQAAALLRCSLHSYRMWRRRNGLRPNTGRKVSA